MCYSGYNVEDAVIFNEASLKRGMFRTTYYNTYEAHEELERVGNINIETKFMDIMDTNVVGLKPGYDYSNLDKKSGIWNISLSKPSRHLSYPVLATNAKVSNLSPCCVITQISESLSGILL